VDRQSAPHMFDSLLSANRHSWDLYRPALLDVSGVASSPATYRLRDATLRSMVMDRLSRGGRLILTHEGLGLPPCGVGHRPTELKEEETKGGGGWTGNSAKWSQEKKLLSLHPKMRPMVQGVLDGMTERGFQPKIFYAWRSVAVQLKILKEGHSKVKFSFHNVQHKDGTPNAHAADIVDKRWAWSPAAAKHGYWKALGEEAKIQKLHWGGDWKKPDWAHVQLLPNSALKRMKKESGL
jgi:hypothetical protein